MAIKNHVWDKAAKIPIERSCPTPSYSGPLEPGVKYFVLQLERQGLLTVFSCEGHPDGFYITFVAPEATARDIASTGYFSVDLPNNRSMERCWNLRLSCQSEQTKRRYLRLAAEAWEKHFGALDLDAVREWPPGQPFGPSRLG